ncbi:MAG TPA: hypothetical protein VLT16_19275 [Candidatus Limnocylindrales bacterium]|nr:hypothetical protein [Candidatus Limnocylindrales bacterium]
MKSDRAKLALGFTLFALFITAVGFGFDRLLLREGVPRLDILLVSNLLTGLVAAALLLQLKIRSLEKQSILEDRLKKIADMNHHVRNALQVVAFYRHQISDPQAAKLIQDSIDRIEWTLNEVLPRGWDLDDPPRAEPPRQPLRQ